MEPKLLELLNKIPEFMNQGEPKSAETELNKWLEGEVKHELIKFHKRAVWDIIHKTENNNG